MSSYLNALEPTKATLVSGTLGIISTTVFYSMNTTINYLTIPTVFLGRPARQGSQSASPSFLVPSTDTPASPVSHLNRQWQEIYWRGHRVGPASAGFSGFALGTASYFAETPLKRWFFGAAAVTAMAAWPYTLVAMVPTNDELHRRGDAITDGVDGKKDFDEQETTALLAKWVGMSKMRAGIALVATTLGVAGLLL